MFSARWSALGDDRCTDWSYLSAKKPGRYAIENGFAASPKDYKKEPELYKGHVGDLCEAIRVMVTGRTKSPDLFSIMKVLGKDRINERINSFETFQK